MTEKCKSVIFIGKGGVGKTLLLRSFIYTDTDSKYHPTIVDQKDHTYNRGDRTINVRFFDLAGQEDYTYMYNVFIDEANIALLCCEKGNMESFYEIKNLFLPILEQRKKEIQTYFVITKCDLNESVQVDKDFTAAAITKEKLEMFNSAVEKLCTEKNLPKRYTSSKTKEGVNGLLDEILLGRAVDEERPAPLKLCYFCC